MSLTKVTYSMITGASVNVLDYGADPSGVNDSTVAFTTALEQEKTVWVPSGTYKVNVTATKPFVLIGEGSQRTVLEPFDISIAAFTYHPTPSSPYWTYNSEVRNIGFTTSSTAKTGVGFTFGTTQQANYTAGMEFDNNVKFYGCRFYNLNKGVQFPFGNIGTEFYSCGFSANYYGVYCLDNRNYPSVSGAQVMHAGNKYFFGGQFDSNYCAVYVFNLTQGFGGIDLYSTIIEYNNIGIFCYTNNTNFTPVKFNSVWLEGNGASVSAADISIDIWSGTTATPTNYNPHACIFDGSNSSYVYDSGFATDIYLLATNSRLHIKDSQVETYSGYNGAPFLNPSANSQIIFENITTDGGVINSLPPKTFIKGNFKPQVYAIGTPNPASRGCMIPHRYNKSGGSYGGSNTVVTLTSASNLGNGSFNVTAGTTSDGVIYGTCNTYSIPFTSVTQYTALIAGTVTLSLGQWYVVTFDVKVISGQPTFNSWNRSSNQLIVGLSVPENNVWYTVGALGYCENADPAFYALDIGTQSATAAEVRLSAFQICSFGSEFEAQEFLASNTYVGI